MLASTAGLCARGAIALAGSPGTTNSSRKASTTTPATAITPNTQAPDQRPSHESLLRSGLNALAPSPTSRNASVSPMIARPGAITRSGA